MKVYLLRHGETYLNKIGGHFQGQIDTKEADLDETGRAQAAAAAVEFKDLGITFDAVWSSPQKRAVETAVLASGFPKEQMHFDDRLKEQNFGPLDGKPWEEMNPKTFHALMKDAAHYYPGPGMESIFQLIRRASDFLDELARKGGTAGMAGLTKKGAPAGMPESSGTGTKAGDPDVRILVSTHGGVIRAMLHHLQHTDLIHFWEIPVGNCAWYELTLQDGKFVVTHSCSKV